MIKQIKSKTLPPCSLLCFLALLAGAGKEGGLFGSIKCYNYHFMIKQIKPKTISPCSFLLVFLFY